MVKNKTGLGVVLKMVGLAMCTMSYLTGPTGHYNIHMELNWIWTIYSAPYKFHSSLSFLWPHSGIILLLKWDFVVINKDAFWSIMRYPISDIQMGSWAEIILTIRRHPHISIDINWQRACRFTIICCWWLFYVGWLQRSNTK